MPAFNNKILTKIIVWQHKLKTKKSSPVHQVETTGSIKPLLLLIMSAFAYGAIHSYSIIACLGICRFFFNGTRNIIFRGKFINLFY